MYSFDNASIHDMELLEELGVTSGGHGNRVLLPARSPDMHKVVEHVIIEAEVLQAMKRLRNGKACDKASWTAELLRYTSYRSASGGGTPVKVWPLALLLMAMLDAFLQAGRVPISVTYALVTPIHTKGYDLDIGKYRPIAVAEPFCILYTIILNKSERLGLH